MDGLAVTVEPAWVARLAALSRVGLALGMLALGMAGRAPVSVWPWISSAIWAATAMSWIGSAVARARARGRAPVSVVVEDDVLRVGDRSIARSSIETGVVALQAAPRRGERIALIELRRKGGALRLGTRDLEGARQLLVQLGLDAPDRAITRRLVSPANDVRVVGPVAAAAVLAPITLVLDSLWPSILSVALLFALGLVPSRVTVGADVVRWSWLFFSSSVRTVDIERVEVRSAGLLRARLVRLHLTGGRRFTIRIGLRGHNVFEPFSLQEESLVIAERIERALAAVRAGAKERSVRAPAAGTTTSEWVEALSHAASPDYRQAGGAAQAELEAVASDAAQSSLLRAGAAAALVRVAPEARPRVRALATATADPDLREALEAAAEGDRAALEGALRALRR